MDILQGSLEFAWTEKFLYQKFVYAATVGLKKTVAEIFKHHKNIQSENMPLTDDGWYQVDTSSFNLKAKTTAEWHQQTWQNQQFGYKCFICNILRQYDISFTSIPYYASKILSELDGMYQHF